HYFMAMLVIIVVASYMKLGRNEDPTFTIKAMTVRVLWPGATLDDTLQQITERVERKLQETPYLDYIKSYLIRVNRRSSSISSDRLGRRRWRMPGTRSARSSKTSNCLCRTPSSAPSPT